MKHKNSFFANCQLSIAHCSLPIAYCLLIFANWLLPASSFAQPSFIWAKGITTPDVGQSVSSSGIAVDGSGNVYTTGTFRGQISFGAFTLSSIKAGAAYSNDIFVCKQDAAGNFKWAKQIGGKTADYGSDLMVDNNGNVHVTGYFSQTTDSIDFNPGVGTYNLISGGGYDAFVLKLDTDGNFIWAKNMSGSNSTIAQGIALDASGNVYTTGSFVDTVDFDPGFSGVHNLISTGPFNTGIPDIYVSKLDPSGNFVWAKSMGGASADYASDINIDGNGNVYTTGSFIDTADFDPGLGTHNLMSLASHIFAGSVTQGQSIFVSKLAPDGNFLWAKSMGGGTDSDYLTKAESIATDAGGNVYFSGTYSDTVDFDPGNGVHNLVAHAGYNNDAFISKLDPSGNFVWAKTWGIFGNDFAWGMTVDAAGNSYTVGEYVFGIDIDPGVGAYNLISPGGGAAYVNKLDASGNFLCAASLAGKAGTASAKAVAVDGSGNVHTTGFYGKFISNYVDDFNPSNCEYNLSGSGMFISKLGLCTTREPASVSGPTVFCIGDSVILNAGFGYASYKWLPGGETSQKLTAKTSDTYSVITTGECLDTLPSFVVTVNSTLPVAAITPSGATTFCWGDKVTLDAGTGYLSYRWLPYGDSTQSILVQNLNTYSVTVAGTYSVIVDNGCGKDTAAVPIVITYPQFVNAGPDATICQGASTTLNGSMDVGTVDNYWLLPIPWDPEQKLSDIFILNPEATPASTHVYILTGLNGGCYDIDSVTVTVIKSTINAGVDVTICSGSAATLSAGGGTSYTWSPTTGLSGTTGLTITAGPTTTITYTLSGATTQGCTGIDTVLITVLPLPTVFAGTDVSICQGSDTTLNASGGTAYRWSPPDGLSDSTIANPVVNTLSSITYTVKVSDNGCSNTDTLTITVEPLPVAFAGADITVNSGSLFTLTASGGTSYSWSNGAGSSSVSVSALIDANYCVTVSSNGCKASDCMDVTVMNCEEIFIPTAFSPNNDGTNDVLYVKADCVQQMEFKIFDRWGNKVFESTRVMDGWDGMYKGKALNQSMFVYYMDMVLFSGELINRKGNVTLMR